MAPIPSISRAKDKEEVEGKESQAQSPYNTHTKCLVTLSRTSFIIKSVQHKGLQDGPKHIYTVDWRSSLYNSTFSDVNNLGESLRERLFCKKNCKGARVGGRDAREDCSQGSLRYQRGYPPSFSSLFLFSLSLLLIPAMHQLDEMCELFRSRSIFAIRKKTGELGSHLYVSAEGEYEVIKDGKVLGRCTIIFIISIIMIITIIFPTCGQYL